MCLPRAEGSLYNVSIETFEGARWRSGRESDSDSVGPGFEPHKRHRVVSFSKAH